MVKEAQLQQHTMACADFITVILQVPVVALIRMRDVVQAGYLVRGTLRSDQPQERVATNSPAPLGPWAAP